MKEETEHWDIGSYFTEKASHIIDRLWYGSTLPQARRCRAGYQYITRKSKGEKNSAANAG